MAFKILLFLFLIVMIGCGDNKSVKEKELSGGNLVERKLEPVDTLTIDKFCEICYENIVKAEDIFLKKDILISGSIESIDKINNTTTIVISNMEEEKMLNSECISLIECTIDNSDANMEKVMELKDGAAITLGGNITKLSKTNNVIAASMDNSIVF